MTLRNSASFRIALVGVAAPAALLLGAGPALAATDVTVSNTETIQAHLDASGKVKDKRIYEELAFTGQGSVDVANPVSSDGLRNLDGFGGYDVKDGKLVTKVDVSGEKRLRTVSNFTKDLPLKVEITYTLDGRQVKPGDVVGKSGILEVHYKVTNVTGKSGSVSFDDGTGTQVTKDEQVVIPMVGSLSTVLPSTFTEVQSDQANMAGDGRGGTKLSFTMTLFPPIGSDTAEFGYKARIRDGVVPAATISALPVNPLQSPSFKGGADSYKGGADTGAQLTNGAMQIDDNLLKLRDGASTLLAGLLKLKDGANQLNAGLSGQAAPGAAKLADGAGQLKAGTGQLFKGAGDAKAGADKLSVGSGQLAAGAGALTEGLGQILDGLDALPTQLKSDPEFMRLKGALDSIQAGIGKPSDATTSTLLGGLNLIGAGLRNPNYGPSTCDRNRNDDANPADDCGAGDAAEILATRLTSADSQIAALIGAAQAAYGDIAANSAGTCPALGADGLPPLSAFASPGSPCYMQASVIFGLAGTAGALPSLPDGGLRVQTATAAAVAVSMFNGIDDNLLPGLSKIRKGLYNEPCNAKQKDKNASDFCGISQGAAAISAGIDQLVEAIVDGVGSAVYQAYVGSGQVADGAKQVAGGAGQLDAGLGKIKSGAGQLDSGAGQLADGANQLQSGLQDAADGSGQLAAGLDKAAGGAPQLKDGAQRLSDEGTKVLIGKGKDTAQNFGEKYALIKAGADRAQAESMAYGAPEGATGQTAYTLEIAGEDGEGGRNWARGLGALAVFAIGGGAAAAVRQRLV